MKKTTITIKEEHQLIQKIKKIFEIIPINERSKNIEYSDRMSVMDNANVVMIEAISDDAKTILNSFIRKNYVIPKTPTIEYEDTPRKGTYNQEYLSSIIEILNVTEGSIKISSGAGMPLIMSNQHFQLILAPLMVGY